MLYSAIACGLQNSAPERAEVSGPCSLCQRRLGDSTIRRLGGLWLGTLIGFGTGNGYLEASVLMPNAQTLPVVNHPVRVPALPISHSHRKALRPHFQSLLHHPTILSPQLAPSLRHPRPPRPPPPTDSVVISFSQHPDVLNSLSCHRLLIPFTAGRDPCCLLCDSFPIPLPATFPRARHLRCVRRLTTRRSKTARLCPTGRRRTTFLALRPYDIWLLRNTPPFSSYRSDDCSLPSTAPVLTRSCARETQAPGLPRLATAPNRAGFSFIGILPILNLRVYMSIGSLFQTTEGATSPGVV